MRRRDVATRESLGKSFARVREPRHEASLARALPSERRYKSNLEERYAVRLELLRSAGEIVDWYYEPFNIRLADGTFYRVDWAIKMPDGTIECHETKGWHANMRDSRTRWKIAADRLPWFRWVFVTERRRRGGSEWEMEVYGLDKTGPTR